MKQDQIAHALTEIKALLREQGNQPMTLAEASTYLNLSRSTVYGMTSRGEIAHFKPNGKKLVFRKSDLDAYLFRRRVASREEMCSEAE